jgi:hypothetical protein
VGFVKTLDYRIISYHLEGNLSGVKTRDKIQHQSKVTFVQSSEIHMLIGRSNSDA